MKKSELRQLIRDIINEEKWAQNVDVEKGKMHKKLGVPENKNIKDVYSSGKKLAKDLLKAVGNKKEATGMIAYAANVNSEKNVFDDALKAVKNL